MLADRLDSSAAYAGMAALARSHYRRLWEVFENSNFIIQRYRADTASLGYQGDTIVNSFGDMLCAVAGFMIARRLGFRRSLVLFLVLELVLLAWIRDSLLLEVLMLAHPVSAIRAWQMCH